MDKTIEITKEHCKGCALAANNAVNIDTCKGCAIGVIGDATIFKRVDINYTQITIFDFLKEDPTNGHRD